MAKLADADPQATAMLLTAIAKLGQEEARLFGDYAPTKIAATNPDGDRWAPVSLAMSRLSLEELRLLKKLSDQQLLGPPEDEDVVNVE